VDKPAHYPPGQRAARALRVDQTGTVRASAASACGRQARQGQAGLPLNGGPLRLAQPPMRG